jgi:hypothetical protein
MQGYEERIAKADGLAGIKRTLYSPQGPFKANHLLVVEFVDGSSKQKEFGLWTEAVVGLSAPLDEVFPEPE